MASGAVRRGVRGRGGCGSSPSGRGHRLTPWFSTSRLSWGLASGTLEASGMTPGKSPAGSDRSVIADVALALAGTQILAQVADDASLDGRATGLIGFNGALLAVTIAAKGLLGTFWWAPQVVVVISTLMLLRALYGRFIDQRSSKLGLHSADIGVGARPFYEGYAEQPALAAQEVLLRDLS